MVLDVRERAEAVDLRLEEKVWMIERLRNAQQAHRRIARIHLVLSPSGYRAPVSVSIVQSGADTAPVLGVAAELTRGPARVMSARRSSEPTSQTMIPPPFHEDRGALEWSRRSRILHSARQQASRSAGLKLPEFASAAGT
jgi:hypothetical protein